MVNQPMFSLRKCKHARIQHPNQWLYKLNPGGGAQEARPAAAQPRALRWRGGRPFVLLLFSLSLCIYIYIYMYRESTNINTNTYIHTLQLHTHLYMYIDM